MARTYFPHENIHGPVQMKSGSDRVLFNNSEPLSIEKQNARGGVVFFGDSLPENIVRGKQYFLIESQPQYVRIAEKPAGPAITFSGNGGPNTKMMSDLFRCYWHCTRPRELVRAKCLLILLVARM